MKKLLKIFIVFFLINIVILARDTAMVATFNTLHLGWKGKNHKKTAEALVYFDLIGLQEVMTEEGLKTLKKELEKITNKKWDYHISDKKVGTGSYKEHYAYLWQKDKVNLKKVYGFFPETEDIYFEREPYGVDFKIGEFDFTFVLFHLIFGEKKSERQREASLLNNVYNYFQEINGDENDVILAGDFNLPAYDDSFKSLFQNKDEIFYALDPTNKTTVGKKGLSSSYDNLFFSYKYTKEYTGEVGVFDFTNNDYSIVRKIISDHLPVFMNFYIDEDDD